MSRFHSTISDEGAVMLWPDELEHIAFGQLDLEQVAELDAILEQARPKHRRFLDAEQTRAVVVDLAERRQRRADQQRPERGAR